MRISFRADFTRSRVLVPALLCLALAACQTPRAPAPVVVAPAAPAPGTSPAAPSVAPAAPGATAAPLPPPPPPVFEAASFASLPGWNDDNLTPAWPAFLQSCRAMQNRAEWREVCAAASALRATDTVTLHNFFETRFVPYRVRTVDGVDAGLVTGYYEPLLRGSRRPVAPYLTPLYGVPDDLLTIDLTDVYPELKGMRLRGRMQGKKIVAYPDRAALAGPAAGTLSGKEIVWVDDPIEAFFLEVQGSGRVQLFNGKQPAETIRVAYADQNGRPYKSIGRWLVDRGELTLDQASMQSIQAWVRSHPERLQELLNANPSVVFFKESPLADPSIGPNGALGVPLTPERSIAVDIKVMPLGAPVFLATTRPNTSEPLNRLTLAQDTGGAIAVPKGGAVRADYFWGFGAPAGEQAGRMKQSGRMWLLWPRESVPPQPQVQLQIQPR